MYHNETFDHHSTTLITLAQIQLKCDGLLFAPLNQEWSIYIKNRIVSICRTILTYLSNVKVECHLIRAIDGRSPNLSLLTR